MTFSDAFNGLYQLGSVGGGPVFQSIWKASIHFNIKNILNLADIPYVNGATRIRVSIDNTLTTGSEAGTRAFIAKKSFLNTNGTAVPEASTNVLLAVAGLATVVLMTTRRFVRSAA
jgi:hypothetical protein